MIQCNQCHKNHLPVHADIRFVRCDCGATLDRQGNIINLKEQSLTDLVPSFLKQGQKGRYAGKGFEIAGRIKVWSDEGILSYWTLLFEDNSLLTLEEGYGNFGLLEPIPEDKITYGIQRNYSPNAKIKISYAEQLNADIIADVLYVSLEGQTSLSILNPTRIVYASSVYSNKNFELWLAARQEELFRIIGLEFETLNLEGVIHEDLSFGTPSKIYCEKCSTPFDVPLFPYVQTAACTNCEAVYSFDAPKKKWNYVFPHTESINRAEEEELPIGNKVTILKDDFEIIGKVWKRNQHHHYWLEYHLYNAVEGSFAYLSHSEGHFILLYELFDPPKFTENYRDTVRFFKRSFRNYDIYQAEIVCIEGNIVGTFGTFERSAKAFDYVAAPYMLSLELGKNDANHWFFGEYVPRREMKKIYAAAQKKLPSRSGYGAARPANKFSISDIMLITGMMLLAYLGVQMWLTSANQQRKIATEVFQIDSSTKQLTIDNVAITENRTEIDIEAMAEVTNDWVVLNYSLINKASGAEAEGGQEIGYYYGVEGGESWSEGSRTNSYKFSGVDKGDYKLVVDVEHNPVQHYSSVLLTLQVSTDGQLGKNFWFPFWLIMGWAIFAIIKYFAVESYRFSEA